MPSTPERCCYFTKLFICLKQLCTVSVLASLIENAGLLFVPLRSTLAQTCELRSVSSVLTEHSEMFDN